MEHFAYVLNKQVVEGVLVGVTESPGRQGWNLNLFHVWAKMALFLPNIYLHLLTCMGRFWGKINVNPVHNLRLYESTGRTCRDQWKETTETTIFLMVPGMIATHLNRARVRRKGRVYIGNSPVSDVRTHPRSVFAPGRTTMSVRKGFTTICQSGVQTIVFQPPQLRVY